MTTADADPDQVVPDENGQPLRSSRAMVRAAIRSRPELLSLLAGAFSDPDLSLEDVRARMARELGDTPSWSLLYFLAEEALRAGVLDVARCGSPRSAATLDNTAVHHADLMLLAPAVLAALELTRRTAQWFRVAAVTKMQARVTGSVGGMPAGVLGPDPSRARPDPLSAAAYCRAALTLLEGPVAADSAPRARLLLVDAVRALSRVAQV